MTIKLSELEALEREASKGPWVAATTRHHCMESSYNMYSDWEVTCPERFDTNGDDNCTVAESLADGADAQLIAAARNALPELLAWVRDARKYIKAVYAYSCECDGDSPDEMCEFCVSVNNLLTRIKD